MLSAHGKTAFTSLLVATAAALGLALGPADTAPETDAVKDTDRRVDVGGFSLRARVLGQGTPTVVFDTGAGDTLETWGDIPAELAQTCQVVVYDRAGLGGSDQGPLPRDGWRAARELQALLERLGTSPPYVMVGHSLGGANIRFFAALSPDQVAGFVFIDSTTEQMRPRFDSEEDRQAWEARLQQIPPGPRAELLALPQTIEEMQELGPPPDRPAVVLTGMAEPNPTEEQLQASGMTLERLRELQQRGFRLHAELAARFTEGRHVAARQSQHFVHQDQPDLVLEEIQQLLAHIRRGSS